MIFNIGVSKGVRNPCGLVTIEGCIRDLLDVAAAQAGNAQIIFNCGNNAAHQFVIRRLLLWSSGEIEYRKDTALQTETRTDKLRIIGQMQATNNRFGHFFGFGGLNFAFDRRIFNGTIFRSHFSLRPGNPLCIDDHVRLGSIPGRRDCDVDGTKYDRQTGDQSN